MIMSNIKYCIRIGILFLAGIIVFGCNEDRQNEKDSDIFQINIPLTSGDKPLFADSLFCGKEIVPLETTPECLISPIDKLEIADDKLYLLDNEQDFIFIFSRQGKFINKIDDIGRGPEEYYELSDFHIDDSLIYVTVGSGRNKKVSEKDAFFFCYAARLLSIFIFKTSLVFSIISFGKVILQK